MISISPEFTVYKSVKTIRLNEHEAFEVENQLWVYIRE